MSKIVISGIQQVGIGVTNMPEAWKWFRTHFGVDIRIFEEEAEANLMLPYTGGIPRSRHAALAINLQGGGGFEIWQYKGRIPEAPKNPVLLGDYGIMAAKIKCHDVNQTHKQFATNGLQITTVSNDPVDGPSFFVKDPFGNYFQLVSSTSWFKDEGKLTGGVYGALIGVSDMEKSKSFYSNILGYDKVIYDKSGVFTDLEGIAGGTNTFRRALLRYSKPRSGAFSKLLGDSEIELFQVMDRKANSIFEGRLWGDLGFIHLCFDVNGMAAIGEQCAAFGHPFTVDSGNFGMGEAAGHFTYIDDPDGTLIEFVETHKVPVIKKIGFYLNLKNRNPEKALPDWMLKAMAFNRVK